jgi:hypothetical protein
MNFNEALEILGIEKYAERIFKSNSRGELFHLQTYFVLAEHIGKTDWFANWFDEVVKWAEENWERPESIFQHIDKVLEQQLNAT